MTKIKPKFSRLSIVSNAKNKYGPEGLSEFVKKAVKLCAIMAIVLFAVKDRFLELPALIGKPANALPMYYFKETIFFIGLITGAAALIGFLDMPWRKYQHTKRLRMSHEEMKRENNCLDYFRLYLRISIEYFRSSQNKKILFGID